MRIFIISLLSLTFSLVAGATETKVLVRAKAKDAKFIGSSIGGAQVLIKNQVTGELLASGLTTGSTGNTTKIMKTPHTRGALLSDEQTAGFMAILDLEQPTLVTIEVLAPINQRQSIVRTSTEVWLIPGKHMLGDGIVLEVPGFVIDVIAPRAHERMALSSLKDAQLQVEANIVMMCGCPVSSGGTWDADKMEVTAVLLKNGQVQNKYKMSVTQTSLFSTNIEIKEKGNYEIIVTAFQQSTNNTGVDKVNFIIN